MAECFRFAGTDGQAICGIDEAGRGPLAGPVCAAAVVLPASFPIELLADSKKLSEKRRDRAEQAIRALGYWGIGWATSEEIDERNILQATFLAMRRAYGHLLQMTGKKIDLALVDGNQDPVLPVRTISIVKGDAKIPAIMAASIMAKTARDRFMCCCDRKWPLYGFAVHKGYPTALHKKNLRDYGPCPIHRRSFHPNFSGT